MLVRWFQVALVAALLVLARPARAWVEWHYTGEDVDVKFEQERALFHHAIHYRVNMGPLREIEVTGLDARTDVSQEATVVSEDGQTFPLLLETLPPAPDKPGSTVRLRVTESKGLKRGKYTFHLRHALALRDVVSRDGALLAFRFVAPTAPEGYDRAKLSLVLPSTPSAPQLGADSTVSMSVRAGTSFDEVELVRPHVPKGESLLWSLRLDPKTFTISRAAEDSPSDPPATEPSKSTTTRTFGLLIVSVAVALLLFWVLSSARRSVSSDSSPRWSYVASVCVGSSLVAQGFGERVLFGLGVLMATLFAHVHLRAPKPHTLGTVWLPIHRKPVSNRTRWATSLAFLLLVSGWYLSKHEPAVFPTLLAVLAAFVPALVMGERSRNMHHVRRTLETLGLTVSLWGRLCPRRKEACDLRLRVRCPVLPIPGFTGTEVAFGQGLTLLVRLREGSDAEKRARRAFPSIRMTMGRFAEERVAIFRVPDAASLARQISLVFEALRDGRATQAQLREGLTFAGQERRGIDLPIAA